MNEWFYITTQMEGEDECIVDDYFPTLQSALDCIHNDPDWYLMSEWFIEEDHIVTYGKHPALQFTVRVRHEIFPELHRGADWTHHAIGMFIIAAAILNYAFGPTVNGYAFTVLAAFWYGLSWFFDIYKK